MRSYVHKSNSAVATLSKWSAISRFVSFDRKGHEWYCVTDGRLVFEAVRNALEFFAHPYWRGPKPDSKPSSKLFWWATSEPGGCGEIGSNLLPLLFRLNDCWLWWLALQPFGKVPVSPVLALSTNQIGTVVL